MFALGRLSLASRRITGSYDGFHFDAGRSAAPSCSRRVGVASNSASAAQHEKHKTNARPYALRENSCSCATLKIDRWRFWEKAWPITCLGQSLASQYYVRKGGLSHYGYISGYKNENG